jgi:cyclin T
MTPTPPPVPSNTTISTNDSTSTTFLLPSVIAGMSPEEETNKRRKTCRFLEECGRLLKLPRVAVATAMVLFHRFYAKHSFQQHDRFEVAVAALVLAAKTEESPKKVNAVIEEAHKLKVRGMQQGRISQATSTSNNTMDKNSATTALDPKGEEFQKLKERILLLERVILHTIGFELSIAHPYKYIVDTIKRLVNKRQVEYKSATSTTAADTNTTTTTTVKKSTNQANLELMNVMVQIAMNFCNDSMQTSLCLQFGPQTIATACVFLAAQFAHVIPSNKASWLHVLGYPDIYALATISLQIVELIADRKASDVALIQSIRENLEQLRREQEQGGGMAEEEAPVAKRARVG